MWWAWFSRAESSDEDACATTQAADVGTDNAAPSEREPALRTRCQVSSNGAKEEDFDAQDLLRYLSEYQVYDIFERSDGSRVSAPRRDWLEALEEVTTSTAGQTPAQVVAKATGPPPPKGPIALPRQPVSFPEEPWLLLTASTAASSSSSRPSAKGKSKAAPPPPPSGKAKGTGRAALPKAHSGMPSKPPPPPFGKRLHWKLLPAASLEATIFKELQPWEEVSTPLDTRKICSIFAPSSQADKRPTPADKSRLPPSGNDANGGAGSVKRPSGVGQQVCLLDAKRAQNLAIVLRQVTVPTEELSEGIRSLQLSPAVTLDMLEHVHENLLPALLECHDLMVYEGSTEALRDVERQLIPLARVPRLKQRMRMLMFSKTVPVASAGLQARIQALREGCMQVRNSSAFRSVLGTVLRVGNFLNHGVDAPDVGGGVEVRGFAIDGLLKLRDFRAAQGSEMSALHCVVLHLLPANPSLLATLRKELQVALEPCEGAGTQCAAEGLSDLAEATGRFRTEIQFMQSEIDNFPSSYRAKAHPQEQSQGEELTDEADRSQDEDESRPADALSVLLGMVRDSQETAERLDAELAEALRLAVHLLEYFGERTRHDPSWHQSPDGLEAVERFFAIIREFIASMEECWREVQEQPKKLRMAGLQPDKIASAQNTSSCRDVAAADRAAGPQDTKEAMYQQLASSLSGVTGPRRRPSAKA
mmetsp:Transcript_11786/g.26693  ORF Transcript_11786/g.26693 Transcript_11786/m.26693 type:complete len:703 (-) Transcript_11786:102-2210(-)